MKPRTRLRLAILLGFALLSQAIQEPATLPATPAATAPKSVI